MSVSEANPSPSGELEVLGERVFLLEEKNAELIKKYADLMMRISILKTRMRN